METFLHLNRWLHIAAGFTGFFVAPVALLVRKGGAAHRLWGRVFFWAMLEPVMDWWPGKRLLPAGA
ncbi:DUF2306 domain-containing protein [Hymenobacter psychrophilus]|uniref:Uncharacterized protein n=1 Tax=Hymenobacter psychrophilus TaxID=651662 RepID=A0A1H3NN02_9BACT|nr:hypothetical protein [Hymenobacter psychrophilus]SDY90168.1 hypothetical protein SAMN04488069_1181 [Hymenobacter psychrophilus]